MGNFQIPNESRDTQFYSFVDIEALAAYLGVSVRCIRSWVAKREIPYYKFVGNIRFDLEEIASWIQANRVAKQDSITLGQFKPRPVTHRPRAVGGE